jgi:hypothetical protein
LKTRWRRPQAKDRKIQSRLNQIQRIREVHPKRRKEVIQARNRIEKTAKKRTTMEITMRI